jgi:hypothetical protein
MKIFDILFNKLPDKLKSEVILKSTADQIKLVSWAMGGVNYLISSHNKLYSLVFIIPSWVICQYLAIYLLTKIETGEE